MARHDHQWKPAAEVASQQVVRTSAARERDALIRFLAGGEGWQQASRQLSGAFAEPPAASLPRGRKE